MTTVAPKNKEFLEKVMRQANLPDIYDARDISMVIFRTMRDMMPTESSDKIADELGGKGDASKEEIAALWKDKNPVVAFISRVRPPLEIDSDLFLRRISQEAGLPRGVTAEDAIKAVFSATKGELSQERIGEISGFMPGRIQELWQSA